MKAFIKFITARIKFAYETIREMEALEYGN